MRVFTRHQLQVIFSTLYCAFFVPVASHLPFVRRVFQMEAPVETCAPVLCIDGAEPSACVPCEQAAQTLSCETEAPVVAEEGEIPEEQDGAAGEVEGEAAAEADEDYVPAADADADDTVSFSIAPGIFVTGSKAGALARFSKDVVLKKALAHAFRSHKAAATAEYTAWNKAAAAFRKLISNKEYSLRYDAIARARDRALLKARKEYTEHGPAKAIKSFQSTATGLLSLLDAHLQKLASAGLGEYAEFEATKKCKEGLIAALEAQSIYKGAVVAAEAGAGVATPGKRKRARKAEPVAEAVAEAAAEAPMEEVVDLTQDAAPQVPAA